MRSTAKSTQSVFARTVAARGALYISASSPNESPLPQASTIFSSPPLLTKTSHSPSKTT